MEFKEKELYDELMLDGISEGYPIRTSPTFSFDDNSSDFLDFLQDGEEENIGDLVALGEAIDNMDTSSVVQMYHLVYPKYSDEKIMRIIAEHIDYRSMLSLIELIHIIKPRDIVSIYNNLSSELIDGFKGKSLKILFKEFVKEQRDSNFMFPDEKYEKLQQMLDIKDYDSFEIFYDELSIIDRRKFKERIISNLEEYELDKIKFIFNENDIINLISNDKIDIGVISQFIDTSNLRKTSKIIQTVYNKSKDISEVSNILSQCGIMSESNYCETKNNEKSYEDYLGLDNDIIVRAVKQNKYSYAILLLRYRHYLDNVHRDYVYKEIFSNKKELKEFFSDW